MAPNYKQKGITPMSKKSTDSKSVDSKSDDKKPTTGTLINRLSAAGFSPVQVQELVRLFQGK